MVVYFQLLFVIQSLFMYFSSVFVTERCITYKFAGLHFFQYKISHLCPVLYFALEFFITAPLTFNICLFYLLPTFIFVTFLCQFKSVFLINFIKPDDILPNLKIA